MKKLSKVLFLIFLLSLGNLHAQELRIEPPNWWIGFENQEFQLLVHYPNISKAEVELDYPNLKIEQIHQPDSENYLFINLSLNERTQHGAFNLKFTFPNGEVVSYAYSLLAREKKGSEIHGFDSSDAIYLITPDRFANANPENDIVESLLEKSIDRADDYARHGGDIEGITQHLDYIQNMGFTAVWPSPLLENNMKKASYHGYAITDFYKVDPRFGTLSEYKNLAKQLQQKDMKLIMDMVANHCGSEHWWMKDLPFSDWVNYQEEFEAGEKMPTSNHRRTTNQDRYASEYDAAEMQKGWFVQTMPDLNQQNPFMAKYLIQNSIWWVETLHLGGIRQDTYPYPDKHFMADWAKAIMTEYPNFSIVGEEWSYNPLLVGYWQDGNHNYDGYRSYLTSTMDFPMQQNIVDALNQEESWDNGLVKIYEGLANDFGYHSPKDIMIFADNHDKSRIFTQFNEDVANTKMAMGLLLTLPRIPQIYYGTEILMDDTAKPGDHGLIRTDFPGGWKGDEVNVFKNQGLTETQTKFKVFLKKVLNYRKHSKAIHEGKTIHFAPFDGIYVLFRQHENETVMLVLNKNEASTTIALSRFTELNLNGKEFTNLDSDESFIWKDELQLNHGIHIFTTKQ